MLADDYHNGERVRLAAVRALELLDTPSDPSFDAIVALVAQHFACPIGLVTLIDGHRQWFKARCGLQAIETSRDVAFCNYTIQSPSLLVVEDATKDARFRHNPLVTGAPHVRFYAGYPLSIDGKNRIGTIAMPWPSTPTSTTASCQRTVRSASVWS